MLTKENLHHIRTNELEVLARYLKPGCSVLELGAGTGFQARALSARGFEIKAIDLPESSYSASRVFPVLDYDGRTIPFDDASFDVVLSSNVLEHVSDLKAMLAEIRRVLKPGGYALHAMPSPAWRFWTTVAGPLDSLTFLGATLLGRAPPSFGRDRTPLVAFARGFAGRFVPLAHGERGNAFTEIFTFSRRQWLNRFEQNSFEVLRAEPMQLFYTGWCVLGKRCSISTRQRLARFLGSACYVYETRPV